MFNLLFISAIAAEDVGVGGFIKINFPYNGNNAELLSKLTVVVKTPQGSTVDEAEVQPSGYWLIPTPANHELVVSVRGPQGMVFSPATKNVNFPFNSDIDFQILGFAISGKITTRTSTGSIVHVSASLNVQVDQVDGNIHLTTTSSPDGTFSVGPVYSGKYTVQVKDAIADPQTVVVENDCAVCPHLLITDWPQNGKVVFPEGVTPRKIKLSLSGSAQREVETDSDGFFLLKNLNVGNYVLNSAEKGVSISQLSFSVTSSQLPTPLSLQFLGISISGSVKYPNGQPLAGVSLILLPANSKTTTNANGEFCFNSIQPTQTPSLRAELPFYTFNIPQIEAIQTLPIENLQITVQNAKISGTVECSSADLTFSGAISQSFTVTNKSFTVSAPFGKDVVVKAVSECGFESYEFTVQAPSDSIKFRSIKAKVTGSVQCINECSDLKLTMSNSQFKYQIPVDVNGHFEEEVDFGTYSLKLNHPSNQVWSDLVTSLQVTSKNVNANKVAVQKAYKFTVVSSHAMTVQCGEKTLSLQRGSNDVEVESTVISPADCHIFEATDLRENTRIIVSKIEREVVIKNDVAESKSEVFVNNKRIQAPYKFTQDLNELVTVQVAVAAPFYVEPSSLQVSVPKDCSGCGIQFEVIRGVEYSGRIFPPLEGVQVTASDSTGKIIGQTTTTAAGSFTLGSHPSNANITLSATKAGYNIIRHENSFDLDAEKLATISAEFSDEKAHGTLLALTRTDGFKMTTTVSGKSALFTNLAPGEYFVKSIKREHVFEPSMASFTLKDGADQQLHFSVIRSRFGISGEVKSISGRPEPDVEVTAHFSNGEKISDVTDVKGNFRLGNLLPNMSYTVTAAATGTSKAGRITPGSIVVELGEADYEGLKFNSIRPAKNYDVFGTVDIQPAMLDSLVVLLEKEGGIVVQDFKFQSQNTGFFFFTNCTDEKYNVRVASVRSGAEFSCPTVEVDRKRKDVEIKCEVKESNDVAFEIGSQLEASLAAFCLFALFIVLYNFKALSSSIASKFTERRRR